MQKDIKDYTFSALEAEILKLKLPKYTAGQIFSWLYQKQVSDFLKMSNLAKPTRELLNGHFSIGELKSLKKEESRDGTTKFLFGLKDGFAIETAVIPDQDRLTVCLSSQVGCKLGCKFCLSGQNGFERNLTVSEITGQLAALQRCFTQKITNIVFMGIGEPLDNFENLVKTIELITDTKAFALSKQRLCVSTSGLVPNILKLAELDLGIKLSISLHAANDKLRSAIMPINKKYPIKELILAAAAFARHKRNPVTFEYVLLKGVNDSPADALELAKLLKGDNFKVNLIPCNECDLNFKTLDDASAQAFMDIVKDNGVGCTVRKSRGFDISAACGQLRARHL